MIIRGATLISRMAVIFAVLLTFTACGGGGGGGGFYNGDDDNDTPSVSFALFDPQGNSTNTVTSSAPGTLKVSVKNGGANIVVSAETTIGTLFPATGTALTDGSGVATFQLEAGAEKGAGTVSATATVNDVAISSTFGFQIGDNGLRMGYFDDDGTFLENQISIEPKETLAAGGNAQLSVVILNKDGERVGTAEDVRFNSGCIATGQATINPVNPVKSSNGQASTTYTAVGCAGIDAVTASLVGASAQASGSINIASPEANTVTFVSAVPTLIVLRGTGGVGRQETSEVIFKIVDGAGAPIAGVSTALSLSTEVGGLSLSKTSALSDGQGLVKVTVSAGNVATTVRVIASIENGSGQTVATASDLISVTTGLPDQDSISLSVSPTFVVKDGFNTDGIVRTISVRMADKFNNPVVNGTAATFTTEYGAIVGSCTTTNGTCSVQWNSQEPRIPLLSGTTYIRTIEAAPGYDCPSHNGNGGPCPEDLGYIAGGRSTILVHAIGEESFVDRNGNGIMDQDEKDLFQNLPEAFLDTNEDGVYTPELPSCQASPMGSLQCISGAEDKFIDFNDNEEYDLNDNPAVYNGKLCPPEGDGVWCSRELVNVRAQTLVILSANPDWGIILVRDSDKSVVGGTTEGVEYTAYISDLFNNPPGGSTITVTANGGCELLSPGTFTVPNIASTGAYGIPVLTGGEGEVGSISITVDGFTEDFSCSSNPPVDPCDTSPPPPECPNP